MMFRARLAWTLAAALWPLPALGQSQAGNPQEVELLKNDSDPTRPVFFSIRPEFSNPGPGVTQASLIFRYDQAALRARRLLPGKRGVILRFEVPIAATDFPGTPRRVGLGDVYGQILLVPHLTRTGAFVIGTGLLMPTASNRVLGTGKWVLAPATAPVWFFGRRGMFFVKFQDFVSIGGNADRPDINFLLTTPTFIHKGIGRWWVLADSEMKTNWKREARTGVKTGVQVGRGVSARFGIWVKPEVWWGPNRDGRWNLKFGLVWFR
jgi:hypothetical protein